MRERIAPQHCRSNTNIGKHLQLSQASVFHCLRCKVLAATYGPMIGHTVLPVDVLTLIQERWDKNERVFKSNDDDFHLPFGQLTSLDMHYLSITTMTNVEGERNWSPAPEQESLNMTECCQGYPPLASE